MGGIRMGTNTIVLFTRQARELRGKFCPRCGTFRRTAGILTACATFIDQPETISGERIAAWLL